MNPTLLTSLRAGLVSPGIPCFRHTVGAQQMLGECVEAVSRLSRYL